MQARFSIGCDVGGTFTDLVLFDHVSGEVVVEKVLTTPDDPSVGVVEGLRALEARRPNSLPHTGRVAHATTLAANAVIEKKGARVALITTRGFRDVLELRRHVRVTTYRLWDDPPTPLVPRYLRFTVDERTYADGRVLTPLDGEQVKLLVDDLRAQGVESLAVVFLHSYADPVNELEAARILEEEWPALPVSLSHQVLPQAGEFERASSTVVNAYVKPVIAGYLERLARSVAELGIRAPVRLMLSDGGVSSVETAASFPVRLVESGPVAGAVAARDIAGAAGESDVLAYDMGGTTAKACVVRGGELPFTESLEVDRAARFQKGSGFPLGVPAVDLIEIGAGGGSIARRTATGTIQVGPESAGAVPGPACYGRGGEEPTVTDADLLLGYLDPGNFLGGEMPLEIEAANRALARLSSGGDLPPEAAARRVHDVVNEEMAAAIRMHAAEQGADLRRSVMIAFGGAGPVHAFNLCRIVGIPRLLVPPRAGVMSALGLLAAAPGYSLIRAFRTALDDVGAAGMEETLREMERHVHSQLREVDPSGAPTFTRAADCAYVGQGHAVTITLGDSPPGPDSLREAFHRAYGAKYGHAYPDVPVGILSLRVSGMLPGGPDPLSGRRVGAAPAASRAAGARRPARGQGTRKAYSARLREMVPFLVLDRDRLGEAVLEGPVIVEERESTTVVDVGGKLEVDALGNLMIEVDRGVGT